MQTFGRKQLASICVALACALATPAQAQNEKMTPIATPQQPNAIVLGTGRSAALLRRSTDRRATNWIARIDEANVSTPA